LNDARTLLIACPYFVVERIDLIPDSNWQLNATIETWLLMRDGHPQVGPMSLSIGEAAFLETDRSTGQVGGDHFSGLIAYLGTGPGQGLSRSLTGRTAGSSVHSMEVLS
jgi:mannose-6-phosphate isomerase